MRPIKPNTRRQPLWRTVLLVLGAIIIGGGGTVAALAGLKVIDPAKLAFWKSKPVIPAGWIGIPLSARSIPAYTEVTRDDVMNRKTAELELKWVSPNSVPKGIITDLSKILGRVTAHEKPAVYFFKESDFLPQGTSPGVAGGTPPGKRAITLDAAKLKGVHELKEGDHVDLLASVAVDMPGTGHTNSGRSGTNVVAAPDALLLPKRGFVRALVEDGVVVAPVKVRSVPTSVSSLTQGATTRNTPVQEIVLAVAPEEVAPLAEAMDLKYEITCVARSGRPAFTDAHSVRGPVGGTQQGGMSQVFAALGNALLGKDSGTQSKAAPAPGPAKAVNPMKNESPAKDRARADITPGLDPMAGVRYLEVMIGAQRQFVLFTGPGNSPVMEPPDAGSAKAGPGVVPAGAVEESKE